MSRGVANLCILSYTYIYINIPSVHVPFDLKNITVMHNKLYTYFRNIINFKSLFVTDQGMYISFSNSEQIEDHEIFIGVRK